MSKIIPVSITTTEQAVTLDATYQFVWLRNMGENDCLLSDHSDIVAGDDNVTLVKAGESGRIATSGRAVYIKAVSGTSTGEIHAQNFSDAPFKSKARGGGQSITVEPLTVTENGVYTAPTGKAYSPVSVDVQEQPWAPLQDGYSNFWFELTNDTLSPWLNFSAKTADAVIDWGDGSGEVSLDTLTPTHTYSKAGKYVVKVKGVTGIARQISANATNYVYFRILKAVELNNEVTAVAGYGFWQCTGLEHFVATNADMIIATSTFRACGSLQTIILPQNIIVIQSHTFFACTALNAISLPNTVTSISTGAFRSTYLKTITIPLNITNIYAYAFQDCETLSEMHIQATTPPTLGASVFASLPSDWICYVPVGTGDTYKAASGWSAYADHILEEGETPTRAMVAKFNAMKKEATDDGSDSNENR